MRKILLACSAALSLTFVSAETGRCADDVLPPSVTVTGEGKAYAKPDVAFVNVGIVNQASTAIEAMKTNNTSAAALLHTLAQEGVAERDVQTSAFSIYPQYRQDGGSIRPMNTPSKIIGYRVDNQVRVRVRKVAELGTMLDAVVENGANTINGIQFAIDQPEAVMETARKDAIANARHKSEIYAQAAGVKLGKVLYITESSGYNPPVPRHFMAMARSASVLGEPVPIASGEQELNCHVTVVYAIGE